MAHDLQTVRSTIYDAISAIRLIDPHTHINPHDAGSHTLADILGYHYYTELVHSAGMPRGEIEEPGITPRELVGRMVHGLGNITNTANYHWLIHICQAFFGFQDDAITPDNWESLYDAAEQTMASAEWPQMVLDKSNVESVFLTNDFDDDLEGFDSSTYIPCLRTDDLVFHLAKHETRERLEACSGVSLDGSLTSLRAALQQRFEHFVARGARACAISIPPTFTPTMVSDGRASVALEHLLSQGTSADPAHLDAMSRRVFWTLAELCDEYGLPFDLMIGVNRQVYPAGVYQGQDLYDSRVSLIQYRELFNAFPKIKFPISVLASVTNQELVSYSWIFPNVYTNGHWWYSNTPSFIHRDAAARLEAVPRNKQVAYYSDAYKLEFVLPKFDMYRRILARVLAEEFVGENGWSEEKAIALGRQVLRGNVDEIFPSPLLDPASDTTPHLTVQPEATNVIPVAAAVATAASSDEILIADEVIEEAVAEEEETAGELAAFLEMDEEEAIYQTQGDDADKTVAADPDATVADVAETVEDLSAADFTLADEIDPLPTAEEVQSADVADAQLVDNSTLEDVVPLEAEIDPIPLDVGELLGEDDGNPSSPDLHETPIEFLTGDGQVNPDGGSMILEADPTTGELRFPVDGVSPGDADDDLITGD